MVASTFLSIVGGWKDWLMRSQLGVSPLPLGSGEGNLGSPGQQLDDGFAVMRAILTEDGS
jgi:hypothetical protein